ncbi:hypothetical protein L596_017239 [Steinernema carpocapsae]|uniref:Uncharacterized protein n=1 Tax=Steinernema carpocapsae TaxID=34508 RepID=A0A4U5N118_STECR|nr:hypothetical protein L596_017239 [Steinernema carpocapsae]
MSYPETLCKGVGVNKPVYVKNNSYYVFDDKAMVKDVRRHSHSTTIVSNRAINIGPVGQAHLFLWNLLSFLRGSPTICLWIISYDFLRSSCDPS